MEGWGDNEARWAMLVKADGKFKVLMSGLGMPSVADLLAALEHAKVEKPADRLKKTIKESPSYYEALEELVSILLDVATAKTEAKIAQTKASELSDEDDALIWGEYALYYRKMINFLANNIWRFTYWGNWGKYWSHWSPVHVETYETLKYSPTMKALCKELLPLISATVQKLPTNDHYWDLWSMLFDPGQDTQFSDFVDSIVQSPLQDKYAIFSTRTIGAMLGIPATKKYKLNGNWSGVVNVLEPFWEGLRNQDKQHFIDFPTINPYQFLDSVLPLIEAYLNLGKDAALKGWVAEWVDVWKDAPNWEYIKIMVGKLYEKYGREEGPWGLGLVRVEH
jgi:hypothetical protein